MGSWAGVVGLPRRWALLGVLAWAPAAAGVASGQNSSVALLLVALSGAALVARRQGVAGVLVGALTYKPQLAAPLIGLLLLRGRWIGVAVAGAVAVAGHWALGVVATGGRLDWPLAWLDTVRAYQESDLLANGWQAISLPGLAARVGLATGLPWLVLVGYAAGIALVLWCLPALRRMPWPDAVALAAALGLAVSPHAWVYDAALLIPALGVFAARAARRGWPWRDRWWLAAAYGTALLWPIGGIIGVTAMPLVVVVVPIALLERGPFRPQTLVLSPVPSAAATAAGKSAATRVR